MRIVNANYAKYYNQKIQEKRSFVLR